MSLHLRDETARGMTRCFVQFQNTAEVGLENIVFVVVAESSHATFFTNRSAFFCAKKSQGRS